MLGGRPKQQEIASRRVVGCRRLTDLPPAFGSIYSASITQDKTRSISTWTDQELTGLLRTSVGRYGCYRLVMPSFVYMSDEDIASVVGRYQCHDCHSKDFKTNSTLHPEQSQGYLAGGNQMLRPQGKPVVSRNITGDADTGIND